MIATALQSVTEQADVDGAIEVVVVDNASTDGTTAAVEAFVTRASALPLQLASEATVGIARAKNRGARAARGRTIVFLDADSRATPNLARAIHRELDAGVRACSIRIAADSTDWLDRGFFELIEWGKGLFQIRAQMFYCERALFFSAGALDERLQLGEDREFLVRLQRAGVRVGHIRDARILTSPRRLHALPFRLGMLRMFARWTLAHAGLGRRWHY